MKEDFSVNGQLLNTVKAAAILGVTRRTLYVWSQEGILVPLVSVKGRKYYTRMQIDNFLASQSGDKHGVDLDDGSSSEELE